MSVLEIVDLSDDDSNVICSNKHLDHNRNNANKLTSKPRDQVTETIDLDTEFKYKSTLFDNMNHNNIIKPQNSNTTVPIDKEEIFKSHRLEDFNRIYKENKLFAELIETCIGFKNSDGMYRVITRTLVPLYQETDPEYRKSDSFNRMLSKLINVLLKDSSHKFSHIRCLCESLKLHKAKPKRKVPFITLQTNLKETPKAISPNVFNEKDVVIDLADSEDPTLIDVDKYESDVIILDGQISEKENQSSQEENRLLVPISEVVEVQNSVEDKIKHIEERIQVYKEQILKYEESEVDFDSKISPYLQCEKYKALVVKSYKELCALTGEQALKTREVRLQVREGHPAGPVKKLEEFLNKNLDEGGDPPFPDFFDVVQCVEDANVADGLGWKRPQVMAQARSLFTQCGKALQKRRQEREWKDLISKVKKEEIDDDPAERDPELMAKLEQNKKIALKKETNILKRFSEMQYEAPLAKTNRNGDTELDINIRDDDTDYEEDSEINASQNTTHDISQNYSVDTSKIETNKNDSNNKELQSEILLGDIKIKKEPEEDLLPALSQLGSDYTAVVEGIEDPFLIIEILDSSGESDTEECSRKNLKTS